jgi:hypothetical protein
MKNPDHPAQVAAEYFDRQRRYDVTTADNVIHTVEAIDADDAQRYVEAKDRTLGVIRVRPTPSPSFDEILDDAPAPSPATMWRSRPDQTEVEVAIENLARELSARRVMATGVGLINLARKMGLVR